MPRTFQARLSLAFVLVIALTLGLVSVIVLNRLDDYFRQQQTTDLKERTQTVSNFVRSINDIASSGRLIVNADGHVNPNVISALETDRPMSSSSSAGPSGLGMTRNSSPRRTGRSSSPGTSLRHLDRTGSGCR